MRNEYIQSHGFKNKRLPKYQPCADSNIKQFLKFDNITEYQDFCQKNNIKSLKL